MKEGVTMFKMNEVEVDKSFELVYKSAFKDMLENHVRENDREMFLRRMLKTTNMYASSTVWGVVKELLTEMFYYDEEDFEELM